MCTTHTSSKTSSINNLKDYQENEIDSLSYFDNASDKEKDEENFFKDLDSDSHDNVIEKSKDEHFGKVYNNFNFIIIIIQFDDILGFGTFKKIYKGYDFNCGREIAWCEINVEEKDNMKGIPSFVENIENVKKLKHPNLLEYISVWYEKSINRAVIITELLQGGNLREHRKYQKKIKVKLIKKWIKQVLSALDYLHSNNYIHHDLKCQNILVDRISGNLKLGDLIFAENLGDKEYFTKYIGTEEFMAPEVKEGKYTFKADIYSFGLTLIQLITMEKPYKEFQRKIEIYEAKKKGEYPLSFNKIKSAEIKNFILLCLKNEKERPTCKELLKNKWLNDKESPDHNSYVEIINNLRQENFIIDNKKAFSDLQNKNINNEFSPLTSSNSLLYNKKVHKQSSMGPIYSLDISKLNNSKKGNIKFKMNSFRIKKTAFNPTIKGTKNDNKNKDNKSVLSDRTNKNLKYRSKSIFNTKDSSEFLKQEEINSNNFITIYLNIIELDYKLFCIFNETQNQNENILFTIKIIVSNKKWKNKKLPEENIAIEYEYNGEHKSMEIIFENLKKIIELNKNDILFIKNKLNGKISKIIKEKKIRDLKEKINKIINNFEFLINNDEFDYLECLINNKNFDESKLPKEIAEKVQYYKNKKSSIEKLFSLHNLNINEDYKNNYNLICQEYVILNIFDIDNN